MAEQDTYLLKFSATWCGPCKTVAPILKDLTDSKGVALRSVDIDDDAQMAEQYGIRSIPTVIAIKDGEPVGQLVGACPEEKYKELISLLD